MDIKYFFSTINNGSNPTEDDKIFRSQTKEQITYRDASYTCLLKHFVCITRIRNYIREFFKWTFLLTIIGATIILTYIVFKIFNKFYMSDESYKMIEFIPLLVTSIVGFVSAIIAIPLTITKYLFNTEEDKNITSIIEHTQEHDKSGRNWAVTQDNKKTITKGGNTSPQEDPQPPAEFTTA